MKILRLKSLLVISIIVTFILSCSESAEEKISLMIKSYDKSISDFNIKLNEINSDNLDSLSNSTKNLYRAFTDTLINTKLKIAKEIKANDFSKKDKDEILSEFLKIQIKALNLSELFTQAIGDISVKYYDKALADLSNSNSSQNLKMFGPAIKQSLENSLNESKINIEKGIISSKEQTKQLIEEIEKQKKEITENIEKLLE